MFHMPHPKDNNKGYSNIIILKNSLAGKQSKRAETDPKFDDRFKMRQTGFRYEKLM